jgi:hypothetical protein
MMKFVAILLVAALATDVFTCDALKLLSTKWRFNKFQIAPAALILSLGLYVAPNVCNAYAYNEPVTIEKMDQNNGAQDVFSGAFQASQTVKQTALKNNDFELVKQGLLKPSSEPRALKRRALVSCKDAEIRKKAQADLTEKACVNKVMSGDMQFMIDVI